MTTEFTRVYNGEVMTSGEFRLLFSNRSLLPSKHNLVETLGFAKLFCKMANSLSDSITKVYKAARDGTADLTDLLKRLNTDERKTALETKTKDGDEITTPLIIAARNGNLDSVKILLRYKADIEARGTVKDTEGNVFEGCTHSRTSTDSTPLRAAAYDGRLDIVSCLVKHGADVNARDVSGSTPLMITCYNGHVNVVTYLVEHGANVHLQDKDGDTCLHYAAKGGHIEVVSKLLGLGAKEKQNCKRLTPLLVASNYCKIEMVEYFIKRPECTKEQRIDALELLGATIANNVSNVYGIEKAFSYMKRGMEERYEDPSHPLLKKKMEPVEAYQNRKESQTLEELALLEGDDHAIYMEGLIIRERILGTDNTELLYGIRYLGCVFADCDLYDLCLGLWRRSMEIAMNCDAYDEMTKDLESLARLFAEIVQERRPLRPKYIQGVFQKLVAASERLTEKSKSGDLEEKHKNEEEEKLLYYALYLITIYITTSRRFKCVPTFRGSFSIHIFMLLFRFIAESSVFSSDFTRECKTAIEIGAPFEEMCETFLLFSAEKRTGALIPIIVL